MNLTIHPVAQLFPPMDAEQFAELVKDIAAHGQREPITVHEGAVIDGVHRWKACQQLQREPLTKPWLGNGDVTAYVISMNLHRRHLTTGQRAMIAGRIANLPPGRAGQLAAQKHGAGAVTNERAAAMLNVSPRTVEQAHRVQREGSPDLVEAVESGEVPVYTAARVASRYRKSEQLAKAREPKKAPARDPSKPKKLPTVPVLDRIDRALDTMDTLMEAVFLPAIDQLKKDRRADAWAGRAREIRTNLTRFISRCEAV